MVAAVALRRSHLFFVFSFVPPPSDPSILLSIVPPNYRSFLHPSICICIRIRIRIMSSAKNFHALAKASTRLVGRIRRVPSGARAWSRALPTLEVSKQGMPTDGKKTPRRSRGRILDRRVSNFFSTTHSHRRGRINGRRRRWSSWLLSLAVPSQRNDEQCAVLGSDTHTLLVDLLSFSFTSLYLSLLIRQAKNNGSAVDVASAFPSSSSSTGPLHRHGLGDASHAPFFSSALPSDQHHQHLNHPSSSTSSSATLHGVDPAHFQPLGTWSSAQQQQSRSENPFLMTWVPGKAREAVPNLTHGEGVYLYDDQGKQYLDWTSQAVCSNLGHTLPNQLVEAAVHQLQTLPFVYGGIGVPEIRTRLNQLLAEILPGGLRAAVFPSSGAEANEAGILMARRYTGRPKVLSFFRSYHGATGHAGAATGDSRRWYGSDQNPGFLKAFSPFPLFFQPGGIGASDDERVTAALNMLEEQILNEGPDLIASIVIESIVGAGGVLVFPPGYLQGVRAICDKYGILLHLDEVMVGFGRTGRLFGFQHYSGVVPDIMTAAKGISGAAVPLSMTACSPAIMEYFEDKPLGYGSTYQAHPVAMAVAYETIKHLLQHNIVHRVQDQLAPIFASGMQRLADRHPCIKQFRAIGLFGCLDVQDLNGGIPKLQHEPAHDAFRQYRQAYQDNGLVGLHRYPHIHCAPPLVITESELLDGFDRLDRSLTVLDEALGFTSAMDSRDDDATADSA